MREVEALRDYVGAVRLLADEAPSLVDRAIEEHAKAEEALEEARARAIVESVRSTRSSSPTQSCARRARGAGEGRRASARRTPPRHRGAAARGRVKPASGRPTSVRRAAARVELDDAVVVRVGDVELALAVREPFRLPEAGLAGDRELLEPAEHRAALAGRRVDALDLVVERVRDPDSPSPAATPSGCCSRTRRRRRRGRRTRTARRNRTRCELWRTRAGRRSRGCSRSRCRRCRASRRGTRARSAARTRLGDRAVDPELAPGSGERVRLRRRRVVEPDLVRPRHRHVQELAVPGEIPGRAQVLGYDPSVERADAPRRCPPRRACRRRTRARWGGGTPRAGCAPRPRA